MGQSSCCQQSPKVAPQTVDAHAPAPEAAANLAAANSGSTPSRGSSSTPLTGSANASPSAAAGPAPGAPSGLGGSPPPVGGGAGSLLATASPPAASPQRQEQGPRPPDTVQLVQQQVENWQSPKSPALSQALEWRQNTLFTGGQPPPVLSPEASQDSGSSAVSVLRKSQKLSLRVGNRSNALDVSSTTLGAAAGSATRSPRTVALWSSWAQLPIVAKDTLLSAPVASAAAKKPAAVEGAAASGGSSSHQERFTSGGTVRTTFDERARKHRKEDSDSGSDGRRWDDSDLLQEAQPEVT